MRDALPVQAGADFGLLGRLPYGNVQGILSRESWWPLFSEPGMARDEDRIIISCRQLYTGRRPDKPKRCKYVGLRLGHLAGSRMRPLVLYRVQFCCRGIRNTKNLQ
jgi:hypothetical protein